MLPGYMDIPSIFRMELCFAKLTQIYKCVGEMLAFHVVENVGPETVLMATNTAFVQNEARL